MCLCHLAMCTHQKMPFLQRWRGWVGTKLGTTTNKLFRSPQEVLRYERPERFELPTHWFEDRGKAFLKLGEFCGFHLLLVEAVAVDPLVFVGLIGSWGAVAVAKSSTVAHQLNFPSALNFGDAQPHKFN